MLNFRWRIHVLCTHRFVKQKSIKTGIHYSKHGDFAPYIIFSTQVQWTIVSRFMATRMKKLTNFFIDLDYVYPNSFQKFGYMSVCLCIAIKSIVEFFTVFNLCDYFQWKSKKKDERIKYCNSKESKKLCCSKSWLAIIIKHFQSGNQSKQDVEDWSVSLLWLIDYS